MIAQPTTLQRIWGRITEFFTIASDAIITRVRINTRRWRSSYKQPTNDWGRADYDFYERAYFARVKGLELSGLLIKPVISKIASWTLGRAPKWSVQGETAQTALTDWWTAHHSDILAAWEGALKQADAFVVINSDLSVTLLPPDSVDPIVADDDYSNVIGWRVTQVHVHPDSTRRQTIIDEYYVDRRVHRVEVDGVTRSEIIYPNLIGMLPIVHIANQPSTGQVFGHAESEALLPLLHKYGEVFEAAIEGNVLQGRPTPALGFETVDDLDKFDAENARYETQTLPDGTTERVKIYDVDLSQLLVYSGAEFDYKSPQPFTTDTVNLLELKFYLLLEHTELPEFILGNAIKSSDASAQTQMPVFIQFIKARRGKMMKWLVQIATIVLAYLSLMRTRVSAQEPSLQWEELDQQDGTLTLETIKWAFAKGLLTELTALQLMPVEVEDPEGELQRARVEREEREKQAMQRMEAEAKIANATKTPVPIKPGGDVNEMVKYTNGHGEKEKVMA